MPKGDVSDIKVLLDPGEQILWADRPDRSAYVKSDGTRNIAIAGLFFLCLAIYFGLKAADTSATSSDSLEGLVLGHMGSCALFTYFGVYLAVWKPFRGWRRSARVIQIVTDHRIAAIEVSRSSPKIVRQWGVEPLELLEVQFNKDGSGNLLVGRELVSKSGDTIPKSGLFGVRDVEQVKHLVSRQRYAPGKPATWLDARPNVGRLGESSRQKSHAIDTSSLPPRLREYLQEGEEVVWHGQPITRHYISHDAIQSLLVGVGWFAASAIYMSERYMWMFRLSEGSQSASNFAFSMVIELAYFLAVSMSIPAIIAYLQVGRYKYARHIHLVVTKRRAIYYCGSINGDKYQVGSNGATTISTIRIKDKGGWGSLLFGSSFKVDSSSKQLNMPLDNGFIAIQDPRKVAEIIKAQAWAKDIKWK